jgi:tubulin polyglutamylase TTLL1
MERTSNSTQLRSISMNPQPHQTKIKLKWKTDLNKQVITDNYIERGWLETEDEDEDWNIYWASVNSVRNIFNGKTYVKLGDMQVINHFPNYYELCRKDHMAKNIKKYKKILSKEGKNIEAMDFLPLTFVLPGIYLKGLLIYLNLLNRGYDYFFRRI